MSGTGTAALPKPLAVANTAAAALSMASCADAAIGVRTRNPGMTLAADALAVLHLETARRTARGVR